MWYALTQHFSLQNLLSQNNKYNILLTETKTIHDTEMLSNKYVVNVLIWVKYFYYLDGNWL